MPQKITIPLGIEVWQTQGEHAMDQKVEKYLTEGWYFKIGRRSYAYTCSERPGKIIALMYRDFTEVEFATFGASTS